VDVRLTRGLSASTPDSLAWPLDRAKPGRRDTGALVADEGEACCLPLMALGPAVTTPRHDQTVAR
jgi:hypothetical protein